MIDTALDELYNRIYAEHVERAIKQNFKPLTRMQYLKMYKTKL